MSETVRTRRPWFVATLGGMASYLEGATLMSVAMAIVILGKPLHLGTWMDGVLSASLLITFAAGAIIGGRLGDLFGRRAVYSTDLLVYIAGALIVMFSPNQYVLLAGVVVIGLGMGADLPASLALVAEEAPRGRQGSAIAYSQTLLLTGIGVTQVILYFAGSLGALEARLLFGHLCLVALIVWVLRRQISESLVWQESRGRSDAVELRSLRRALRKPFRTALVTTGAVFIVCGMLPNTISQFGVYLIVNVGHSTTQVFSMIGTVGLAFGLVISLGLQRYVDTRYRTLFVAVGIGALIVGPLMPILGHYSLPSMLGLFLCNTVGGTWAGDGMYRVWTQEIFPTELRSTAQGFTYGAARLAMAGVSLVTPTLMSDSPTAFMVVLMGLGAVGSVIALVVIPRLPRLGRVEDIEAADATLAEAGLPTPRAA